MFVATAVVEVVSVRVVLAGVWGTVIVETTVVVWMIVEVRAATVLVLVTVDLTTLITSFTTTQLTLAGYNFGAFCGFFVVPPTGQRGTVRATTGRLGVNASGTSRREAPPAAAMYAGELASGRKLALVLRVTVGVVVDVTVSVVVADRVVVTSTVFVDVCVSVVVKVSVFWLSVTVEVLDVETTAVVVGVVVTVTRLVTFKGTSTEILENVSVKKSTRFGLAHVFVV